LELFDMHFKSSNLVSLGARKRSAARRATTLVELLVVTTLMTIVLAIVTTLAVRLRQWDRQVREHGQHINQLAALAEAIRADARHASKVVLPEKTTIAIGDSDGREIRYELRPDGCRRVAKAPGAASPEIEIFAIGSAEAWKLDSAEPGLHPAYLLSLERSEPEKANSRPTPFFVYATIGGDKP
jgi:type II secretory pathway pseudopilin PulG